MGHQREWIPRRGHFISVCVSVLVCFNYWTEATDPHHSFTRSFYSHSEFQRKPSVCVKAYVCFHESVSTWFICLCLCLCVCVWICVTWDSALPFHCVHWCFQTKIEKDKMEYNNPKTGWQYVRWWKAALNYCQCCPGNPLSSSVG